MSRAVGAGWCVKSPRGLSGSVGMVAVHLKKPHISARVQLMLEKGNREKRSWAENIRKNNIVTVHPNSSPIRAYGSNESVTIIF